MIKKVVVLINVLILMTAIGVATLNACCPEPHLSSGYYLSEYTCVYVDGKLVFMECTFSRLKK